MTKSQTQVLVVGAGPTGLAAAANLARLGIKVRIIDKLIQRSDKSRALGVQAGTLEVIESYFGAEAASEMVGRGCPAHTGFFHIDDCEPFKVDFSQIKSRFNFVLILSQAKTEEILEKILNRFGVKVEMESELIRLEQSATRAVANVRKAGGASEEITADYVIGGDGAHSEVRKQAQIGFEGESYQGDFILADADVTWPWSHGDVQIFVGAKGALACFPLNESSKYRVIVVQKKAHQRTEASTNAGEPIDLAEFSRLANEISPAPISFSNPAWLTRFRVHHRITDRFQQQRVFVAGDAAHIHSPVGGQGMNTGIQDALSLTTKMAKVIKGQKGSAFLRTYEAERRPVARRVLRYTDMVFRLALLKENFVLKAIRKNLVRRLARRPAIQKMIVNGVSEVKIARADLRRRDG